MYGNTDFKMTHFILTFLIRLPFVTRNCTDICLSVLLSENLQTLKYICMFREGNVICF